MCVYVTCGFDIFLCFPFPLGFHGSQVLIQEIRYWILIPINWPNTRSSFFLWKCPLSRRISFSSSLNWPQRNGYQILPASGISLPPSLQILWYKPLVFPRELIKLLLCLGTFKKIINATLIFSALPVHNSCLTATWLGCFSSGKLSPRQYSGSQTLGWLKASSAVRSSSAACKVAF